MTEHDNSPSSISTYGTWFAIAFNFAWNYFNYHRTKSLRSASINFDEFKRIRDPVEAALSDLDDKKESLKVMEMSASSRDQIVSELQQLNKDILAISNTLYSKLKIIDKSKFADGDDWTNSAEECFEQFFATLDRVYNSNTSDDKIKSYIYEATIVLEEILNKIRFRLDEQVKRYADC